jgi:cytochrome c peroxidase
MSIGFDRLAMAAVAAAACVACAPAQPTEQESAPPPAPVAASTAEVATEVNPRLLRRFQQLPSAMESERNPRTEARIDLGRQLFFDGRLSKDGTISCNSCHALDGYGVDGTATSIGIGGQKGQRNAPSVYNAAGHFAQFWDGRSESAEDQATGPIMNPIEMGLHGPELVSRLARIPAYDAGFRRAFPDQAAPVTVANVGHAIAAFERGLVTPGRWDQYLAGDRNALTPPEKEGLKTFLNSGCMVCHTGPYLGGSMFERVGVVEPWPNQQDEGRKKVTKSDSDRMMFKVPSLRNVAKTAPYFHDGSAATLEQAVHMMGKHQLGLEMTEVEVASIVTWLGALTGELPTSYIVRPELPGVTAPPKGAMPL